jgi:hypothetical protein
MCAFGRRDVFFDGRVGNGFVSEDLDVFDDATRQVRRAARGRLRLRRALASDERDSACGDADDRTRLQADSSMPRHVTSLDLKHVQLGRARLAAILSALREEVKAGKAHDIDRRFIGIDSPSFLSGQDLEN